MGVKTGSFVDRLVQDTSRGPSPSIWGDFPCEDAVQGRGGVSLNQPVIEFFDDFTVCPYSPALNSAVSQFGQWSCAADTGSVFSDANEEGGVLKIYMPTSSKGVVLSGGAGSFKIASGATGFPLGPKLWFECRVAPFSVTTAVNGIFVGLVDNVTAQTTSVLPGGSNPPVLLAVGTGYETTSCNGGIGFIKRTATNIADWGVVYAVAGGTPVYPTNLQTLVNTVTGANATAYAAVTNGNGTGFTKLGFLYDPTGGNRAIACTTASGDGTVTQTVGTLYQPTIQFFVNGQLCATFIDRSMIQTARFPVARMAPTIAMTTGTGTDGGMFIDWIRVGQVGTF